jgi:uncharacterized protein YxeA
MEIVIAIILIFILIIILGFILWRLTEANEDIKFLTHKVNLLENKVNQEPEPTVNIDYENLKQEL